LPSFPKPPPITLDDISRHLSAAAEKPDRGRVDIKGVIK
jgi:hypothetical protein